MKRKLFFVLIYPLAVAGIPAIGALLAPTFGSFSFLGTLYLLSLIIGFILWIKYTYDLVHPFIFKKSS